MRWRFRSKLKSSLQQHLAAALKRAAAPLRDLPLAPADDEWRQWVGKSHSDPTKPVIGQDEISNYDVCSGGLTQEFSSILVLHIAIISYVCGNCAAILRQTS